jgi:uncharacterized protein YqjF (DUF2071 family)
LFVHYQVDAATIRARIPGSLELDTYDGQAWIGIVPFRMEGVTKRGWPAPALFCDFPEINVRTYVTHQGKPGVWFFSLTIPSPAVAWFARTFFHLPYRSGCIRQGNEGPHHWYSLQGGKHAFEADYVVGAAAPSRPGSFAHWATERYCLYSEARDGRCFRGEIQHPKWPLHSAALTVNTNTLAGFPLGSQHSEVYFSPRVDVVVWPLQLIS